MLKEALYVREVTHEIPNCVSPAESMRLLSISRSTLDRLCAQGRLTKIRVSDGRVGITFESIERHLASLNDDGRGPSTPSAEDAFPLFLDEDFPKAA